MCGDARADASDRCCCCCLVVSLDLTDVCVDCTNSFHSFCTIVCFPIILLSHLSSLYVFMFLFCNGSFCFYENNSNSMRIFLLVMDATSALFLSRFMFFKNGLICIFFFILVYRHFYFSVLFPSYNS